MQFIEAGEYLTFHRHNNKWHEYVSNKRILYFTIQIIYRINTWASVNNDVCSHESGDLSNNFHELRSHEWKLLANHLIRVTTNTVIYGRPCIILFLTWFSAETQITSSNGNIFRVTGHLCEEFIGPRWIPRTKAGDAELWCFLWSAPE